MRLTIPQCELLCALEPTDTIIVRRYGWSGSWRVNDRHSDPVDLARERGFVRRRTHLSMIDALRGRGALRPTRRTRFANGAIQENYRVTAAARAEAFAMRERSMSRALGSVKDGLARR